MARGHYIGAHPSGVKRTGGTLRNPLPRREMRTREKTAIVVLGAAVRPDGSPSPSLARRIEHARRLHAEGRGAVVIASGGLGRWPPAEAEVIRAGLLAGGVPPEAVVVEGASHTTFENARFSIVLMRARGLSQALVVTDGYHLLRAVMTFRILGMEATGSGPRGLAGTPVPKRVYALLREAVALPFYLLRLILWRAVNGAPPPP